MPEQPIPYRTFAGADMTDDAPRTSDRFERLLLDSARSDVAPPGARERVALAFGIGSPAGGSASGTSELGGGSARHEAPLQSHSAALSRGSGRLAMAGKSAVTGRAALAGKAALVGIVGGVASLLILTRSNVLPAPPAVLPPQPTQPTQPTQSPQPPQPTQPVSAAPTPLPVVAPDEQRELPAAASARPGTAPEQSTHRRKPAARRPAAPAPAAASESLLLAEVARLDQARAALVASDAPLALQHIERYSAEFPHGILAHEAARLEARAHALEAGSASPARDIGKAR